MLLLKDIVKLDTKGEIRSDVQLSDYDKPSLNLSLLQSYIFSTSVPSTFGASTQAVAALDLLDHLRRAFQYERFENRFVAIANYGHGKSHLALVLANYFARPATSPEAQTIFERIEHALNLPAKAQGYREYKEERGEFLVLRLRGDDPRPLREQFFRALKQALAEHEQTRGVQLPFWTGQASEYLRQLTAEQLQRANDFLQHYDLDVPALLQDIEEYHEQAFERYVDLFTHLSHGVPPNLEGHVSLREAIGWAVGEFCGDRGPLAGLLILFDEFSLYVQRYARDRAVGELQDLLQGIEDHRKKTAFLAFAQHDPEEVARQTLHGGQLLQNLQKELGRLPKRFALYSLMESVLDSYLKQSPEGLEQLMANPKVRGLVLGETTEVAWDTFSKHYDQELGWTYEKFREVVTRGCFPLHPMTTALLCHLDMQQGEDIGAARTVLGFVRDQLDYRAEQPAFDNGRINWVLPIALVDYFEHRLAGNMPAMYQSYRAAMYNLEQVLSDRVTDIHRSVLKALLLQEVGRLPPSRRQVELLAHLSGLDPHDALTALKEMSDENIIQYDPIHRLNRFWPSGTDPKRLEEAIREESERLSLEPAALMDGLNELFCDDPRYEFGRVKVDVEWGHTDDWAAEEVIIAPEIINIIPPQAPSGGELQRGSRGIVGWMLLRDESEREGLHKLARDYVELQGASSSSAETPLPVIAIIPKEPVPELEKFFIRLKALEAVARRKDLLEEIGQQTYRQEYERTKTELSKALRRLRGNVEHIWDIDRGPGEIVLPQAYHAAVAASGYGLSVKSVLKQQYDLAYRIRPPEFFTQYSALPTRGPNKLRSAVKTVVKNLLYDRIGNALSGMDNVSKDLCEKYLAKKWGMLTQSWGAPSSYALQKPTSLKLQPAWDLLDRTFAPGVQDARLSEVIPKLLNPPYGFDYNTAMLLLCGWLGYHRAELLLSHRGARIGLGDLEQQVETTKTARDFLNWACVNGLALSRRDPDAALQEMQSIRARIIKGQPPFSQAEAGEAVQALDEFAAQDKQPLDECQRATEAAERLRKALGVAQKYDQEAQKILASLESLYEASDLLELHQKLPSLTVDELVTITQPTVSEIDQRILDQLELAVETERRRVEGLADITLVGTLEHRLHTLKGQLEKQGLTPFVQRVVEIEDMLRKRSRLLKAAEQEAAIQKEIEAMTVDAGLSSLHNYRQRLREMQLVSPELQQARDNKLEAIQREIERLEAFAAGITEQVHNVDLSDIQQIQNNIIRHQDRYVDTPYEEKLSQALGYLETLQHFRADVHDLRQRPLNSPQDVQNAEERLREIASSFEQSLSAIHLQALNHARKNMAEQVKAARQAALQWLEDREQELEHGKVSLGVLHQKLERPPAFLPEDCQARLDALHARIQERLDQDHIAQIESLFQSLGTPEKRKECLNRLLQLVAEES